MATPYTGQLGINITEALSSADAITKWGRKLGQRVRTEDGGEYLCVTMSGSCSASDAIGIDENYEAAELTTAMVRDGWMIGVAQTKLNTNQYGWICVLGSNVTCNVLQACAADVALYASGTAGKLDDSGSTVDIIDGIVAVAAGTASATAAVEVIMAAHPHSAVLP